MVESSKQFLILKSLIAFQDPPSLLKRISSFQSHQHFGAGHPHCLDMQVRFQSVRRTLGVNGDSFGRRPLQLGFNSNQIQKNYSNKFMLIRNFQKYSDICLSHAFSTGESDPMTFHLVEINPVRNHLVELCFAKSLLRFSSHDQYWQGDD